MFDTRIHSTISCDVTSAMNPEQDSGFGLIIQTSWYVNVQREAIFTDQTLVFEVKKCLVAVQEPVKAYLGSDTSLSRF